MLYRNASNGNGDEYEFRFEENAVVCVYFVSLILSGWKFWKMRALFTQKITWSRNTNGISFNSLN